MKQKLKRLFMAVLCMAVIFTAMPVMPVYASDTAAPTISAYTSYTYPGRELYFSIYGSDFPEFYGLDFTVYYDADVMSVTEDTYAGSMLSGAVNSINTETPGAVRIMSASQNPISGGGQLLGIRFKINSDAPLGEYPVVITAGAVYDASFQNISVKTVSGSIIVQENQTPVQQIQFRKTCSKTNVQQGDMIDYSLELLNPYNLAGGSLKFTYDEELLQLDSAELGTGLSDSPALTSINTDTAGVIRVLFAANEPIHSDWVEEYLKLKFTVKANTTASTYIRFEPEELWDVDLNPMSSYGISHSVYLTYVEPVVDHPDLLLESNDDFDEETRTFTVDVSLDEGANVAAGDFTVSYDTSQLVCTNLEENSQLSKDGAYLVTNQTISGGTVRFSYIKEEPFEDKTSLMTLTFQATEGFVGDAVLSSSGLDVVNGDFEAVTLDYPQLTVSVPKVQRKITGPTSYTKTYGDSLFNLESGTTNTDAAAVLIYQSNNEDVVQVSSNGEVLITGAGQAVITVICPETEHYKACSGTVTVTVEQADISSKSLSMAASAVYTGSALKPAVTIDGLVEGRDFTVDYENNVNVGTAAVTVTGIGNYEGQLTAEFEILDFDVLLGDVNLSGHVNAADLTMLARHISGIRPVTDIRSLANADVNGMDGVNAADLKKLARYVAKIITTL